MCEILQKTSKIDPKTVGNSLQIMKTITVSVIITTKNEAKNIQNCLRSVKDQTFQNIDLILVDNFSTDKTVEIAKKYATKVYLKGPERSTQRNFGAKVAVGDYLLYLDADMILSPNTIENCVKTCVVDGVDALYIPELIIGKGFWISVRNFERNFYIGTIVDATRFIRKDLFERVGGFDEKLVGPEDWDLDRRLRKAGRTGVVNTPLYHNEGNFNMKKYLKKKKYYSHGLHNYAIKWGYNDQEIQKQLGIWYRLFGIFFENGNWKQLLRNPLFTLAMYYLRLRVAITYYHNKE